MDDINISVTQGTLQIDSNEGDILSLNNSTILINETIKLSNDNENVNEENNLQGNIISSKCSENNSFTISDKFIFSADGISDLIIGKGNINVSENFNITDNVTFDSNENETNSTVGNLNLLEIDANNKIDNTIPFTLVDKSVYLTYIDLDKIINKNSKCDQ